MIKLALTNGLVNSIAKKIVAKFLSKKLGIDSKVLINELCMVENDGRVILKINAELNMSAKAMESLIENF